MVQHDSASLLLLPADKPSVSLILYFFRVNLAYPEHMRGNKAGEKQKSPLSQAVEKHPSDLLLKGGLSF